MRLFDPPKSSSGASPDVAEGRPMDEKRRLVYALTFAVIVGAGLLSRRPELGLPWPVAKWSGSILWGAMVYVAISLIGPQQKPNHKLLLAAAIALLVEFSRLYHASWLDEFRRTTAGALLLGRIFSPWNLLAYLTGIAAARIADAFLLQRLGVRSGRPAGPEGA